MIVSKEAYANSASNTQVRRELNGVRGELKAAQEAAAKDKQQAEADKTALQQKLSTLIKQTNMKIQKIKNLEVP